ncbi:energy-coupled thiamine transporter ThiT [Oceanobacillus chungangensis]|uniref:Energy-coupled thiamine transporter ThiT n=1 Tax=Oceanobacillus chungangensis TaxID=1229152 RepID=A0A3D8PX21_9BACI|nr:energy-coupled thiamine transporter ThiT [Oceanobacillus chungangensis]RDW19828.1 energy-coupled thiamine transporter ThiT [Oceanobacillus chungangensis]
MNRNLIMMIEASFLAVFALILDLLPSIRLTPAVSISIAMVPIFIMALRWGVKGGIMSGFLWGLLQVVTGDVYILTIWQFLIEYFIAFAFVGFAGLFYKSIQNALQHQKRKKAVAGIVLAVFVGSIARYFWHFIAGVIFWGSYAPEGMSPYLYSFIVNGGTMLGAAILCAIVLVILINAAPRLVLTKNTSNQIWSEQQKKA